MRGFISYQQGKQANYSAAVPLDTLQWGLVSAPLHHYDPDFSSMKAIACKIHPVVWCLKYQDVPR